MQNTLYKVPPKISKFIRSLKHKRNRYQEEAFVVEGEKSFLELIKSNLEIKVIIITKNFLSRHENILQKQRVNIYVVEEQYLITISSLSSNNSVLAVVKLKKESKIKLNKNEYCIALDDIKDPGNLGSIIRIADWYGINKIICSLKTVDVYNQKTIQASMGSFIRVNVWYTDLSVWLKTLDLPKIGTTLEGTSIRKFLFPQKGVIIIGNESVGINQELIYLLDEKISIPKYGKAESLNAAISTAVICDNIRQQH